MSEQRADFEAQPFAVAQGQESKVFATIIRADGRVEEMGLVAATFNKPWERLLWRWIGKPRAARRARRANRRVMKGS